MGEVILRASLGKGKVGKFTSFASPWLITKGRAVGIRYAKCGISSTLAIRLCKATCCTEFKIK